MEKTGANAPIHFNYCRDPRSVADWSPWQRTLDAFAKAESKHKTFVGIIRNLCYKLLVAGGFQRIGSKEIITVDVW